MPGVNGVNMSNIAWKTAGPEQIITGRKIIKSTLNINVNCDLVSINSFDSKFNFFFFFRVTWLYPS